MLPAALSDEGEQHADRVSAQLLPEAVQEPTPARAALSSIVHGGRLRVTSETPPFRVRRQPDSTVASG
jgi:hypothetical protein